MKVESILDVNRLAEINAKMMIKFVSSTSAVSVEILLAVSDKARRHSKCIAF